MRQKDTPCSPEPSKPFAFSNAVRLTGRQWLGIGLFTLALVLLAPFTWEQWEKFDPGHDYRLPYDLNHDYWLYQRLARLAASRNHTLVVGDSVVWGKNVTPAQTLAHYLNEAAGRPCFANLGLLGAHPIALCGLLEHYGTAIRGKNVLLQFNPLWLTSPEADYQTEEELKEFQHPRLIPQFWPNIPRYTERVSESVSVRLGIVVEQHLEFSAWTNHLQQAYFQRKDIPAWTLKHPYENPLEALRQELPAPDHRLRFGPGSWITRGIQQQDYPWVDPADSLQWRFFRQAVDLLRHRDNQIFVLVGPFNEHLLEAGSLSRFLKVKSEIVRWLAEKGLEHAAPEPLRSDLYADSNHPQAAGYKLLAQQLWRDFEARHKPRRSQ
jgi:hypothetical protein